MTGRGHRIATGDADPKSRKQVKNTFLTLRSKFFWSKYSGFGEWSVVKAAFYLSFFSQKSSFYLRENCASCFYPFFSSLLFQKGKWQKTLFHGLHKIPNQEENLQAFTESKSQGHFKQSKEILDALDAAKLKLKAMSEDMKSRYFLMIISLYEKFYAYLLGKIWNFETYLFFLKFPCQKMFRSKRIKIIENCKTYQSCFRWKWILQASFCFQNLTIVQILKPAKIMCDHPVISHSFKVRRTRSIILQSRR